MEINHQLLDQILNVKKVVDSVRPEFNKIDDAENRIYRAKHPYRSFITWFFIYICCFAVSWAVWVPLEKILELPGDSILSNMVIWLPFVLMFLWTVIIKAVKIKINRSLITKDQSIIDKQFEKYSSIMGVIPTDYQYPEAVDILVQIISTGRALTLLDALNLTEEEFHRRNVEKAQEEQLRKLDDLYYRLP